MRKSYLALVLAGLLILLAGCDRSWPTRTPTSTSLPSGTSSPSTALCPTEQYVVGLVPSIPLSETESLPEAGAAESRGFPIQGEEVYLDALDTLVFDTSLSGVARMALARPVADVMAPEPLSTTQVVSWVLLLPEGDSPEVAAWQELRLDLPCGAEGQLLVVEQPIEEVLSFANDTTTQASLQSLMEARDAWQMPGDGEGGLWVDALVIESMDAQGAKSWDLYSFAPLYVAEEAPAGWDKAKTWCCKWAGCGRSVGRAIRACKVRRQCRGVVCR